MESRSTVYYGLSVLTSSKDRKWKWGVSLSFVSNAKKMEAIWSIRDLFSGEYKEGGKESKKKKF